MRALETENSILKSQYGTTPIYDELNEQINSAFKAKKQAEESLSRESSRLKRVTQEVETLKARCEGLEEELGSKEAESRKLRDDVERMQRFSVDSEKVKSEREEHINEIKVLFKEKDQLTQKLLTMREELHT